MSKKEINVLLQNKLSKITKVLPQEKIDEISSKNRKDILYCVKPFYFVLVFFGLQKISFRDDDVFTTSVYPKIYSILMALGVFCTQVYVVAARFQTTFLPSDPANTVTILLSLIPPTITAIASLIMSATCCQKMIVRTLKNFQIIDKQLNIEESLFRPMRLKVIAVMTFIILVSLGMYWYDVNLTIRTGLFLSQISIMPIVIIIKELSLLELALLIGITSTRLDILNAQLENTKYDATKLFTTEVAVISKRTDELMTQAFERFDAGHKAQREKKHTEENVDELTRLMRVFDRLADNANIVNSCFGIQLLSAAISVFINILYTVSELIALSRKVESDEDMKTGNLVMWCLRDLVFVTVVTMVCEMLQSKVKTTSNIINKLSISSKIDPKRQELLERFSQLMACRKFSISACNFFPFDFTFIYSLVGAVATYTVIILQVSQTTPKPKT